MAQSAGELILRMAFLLPMRLLTWNLKHGRADPSAHRYLLAEFISALTKAIPVGRLGQPEDVAVAVTMFASAEAGFITGQTLSVSGGMSMA